MKSDVYEMLRSQALRLLQDSDVGLGDRSAIRRMVTQIVEAYQIDAISGRGSKPLHDTGAMVDRLARSILDYGPLTPFMDGSLDYEELIVHGAEVRYIDERGRLVAHPEPVSEAEVSHVISKLLASVGASIDESRPMIQTQVLDGSGRLGVVIPPIADRIDVTLRRYRAKRETFAELIGWDTISTEAASLLASMVRAPTGVIVTGQPSSGKTTLVNALLRATPPSLRVIVCEDTPELSIEHLGAARWRTRPDAADGSGGVNLRDLVRVSLGMRPDLIVLGEVRGGEAFELTRAGNAGCGMVSTIHANNARQGLQALVTTATMVAPNVAMDHVRHVFSSIIDLVVHLAKEPGATSDDGLGGRRQVMEVVAVPANQGVEVDFTVEPIFVRDDFGLPLRWTGTPLPGELEERVDRSLRTLGTTSRLLLEGQRSLL